MPASPENITKEHVLKAIRKIEEKNIELFNSTRYDVVINGKSYPPKEIMRYARVEYDGSNHWSRPGGHATNKYLERMGFEIEEKFSDKHPYEVLIAEYKKQVKEFGLSGEVYKWDLLAKYNGRPNLEVSNLEEELKDIDFSNLIYHGARRVMQHLAVSEPIEYKNLLGELFNEMRAIEDRISDFIEGVNKLYRSIHSNKNHASHHDERTIAALLTYRNPEKYTFYKYSFYGKLCKLINKEKAKSGNRYIHYYELIKDFISNYIEEDKELLELYDKNKPKNGFEDSHNLLLAQDILYRTLDLGLGLEKSYWRVGTSDDNYSYWEAMKSGNFISIGWKEIGDLNEQEIESKDQIINRLNDEGFFIGKKKNVISRKAGEINDFYQGIQEGDIVLAQKGHEILGIGEVLDEYEYDNELNFPHKRNIKWIGFYPKFNNSIGNLTSVYKLEDRVLIDKIKSFMSTDKSNLQIPSLNKRLNPNLNTILYGPPGTGKTYATKEKAVRIANPDFFTKWTSNDEVIPRKQITIEYNRLCEEGQVVFTTFHQSLSYEDFVEGIKPIMNGKELSYQIESGIFKSICEKAENDWQAWVNDEEIHLPFDEAFDKLREEWEEDNNIQFSLKTLGSEYTILDFTDTSIYFRKASGGTGHTLSIATLRKAYHGEKKINPTGVGIYYPGIIKKLKSYEGQNSLSKKPLKSYILIIDEINRGNVSSIFGELITLLEPDKRLGEKEEVKLKLPYSKDALVDFGVPPNLHIIGTMNTADRSVEALDAALRRRFAFEEVMPQPELLEEVEVSGFTLKELLKTINARIEALLDRDHTIGHSYFFKVKEAGNKEDALRQVFKDSIIPLLQEYFYGDYSRIGLVLGEGFVKQAQKTDEKQFAKFSDLNGSIAVPVRYELISIDINFNIGEALEKLMANA